MFDKQNDTEEAQDLKKDNNMILISRLKSLREDSDTTQKTIADHLHIKQNTYSQYENGHRQIPLEMLISIARYYDVSTDYILGLTDVRTPYPRA